MTVGGGAYKNAGRPDVALPLGLFDDSEAPPVQHAAVEGRQGLAREDELIPRGVLGAPQVQDALHQPVIIEIPSSAGVVAAAEVEKQVALRSFIEPGFIGHGPEHEWSEALRRGSLADVDDSSIIDLDVAGPVGILGSVEAPADRQWKVGPGEEQPPVMLSQPLSLSTQLE